MRHFLEVDPFKLATLIKYVVFSPNLSIRRHVNSGFDLVPDNVLCRSSKKHLGVIAGLLQSRLVLSRMPIRQEAWRRLAVIFRLMCQEPIMYRRILSCNRC